MDINMPIMDGIEATQKIKAISAINNINVIIVACTAFTDSKTKKDSFNAGIDYFLKKPLTRQIL